MTIDYIKSEITKYLELDSTYWFDSLSRKSKYVKARNSLMYILRNDFDLSFPEIGRLIGKDHSTAIHACRKVTKHFDEYKTDIEAIKKRIFGISR